MEEIQEQGDTLREHLALKITPTMRAALERMSEETGASIPKIVRVALEEYMRPEESGDDLFEVTIRVKDLRNVR